MNLNSSEKSQIKKNAGAAALTVALFLVQLGISRLSWLMAEMLPDFRYDPDGLYFRLSVHHILQMLLAFLLIFGLNKAKSISGFNLAPKYSSLGIKHTLVFCAVMVAFYSVVYIVGSFTKTISTYNYELNAVNIAGTIGFQLLLSGPSEEILFRSLPVTLFLFVLKDDNKTNNVLAVVLSAFLFALAHINVFEFSFSWFQICYAFVLGLIYGYTFIKSKSAVYPMIMHSMSNVISVGGCYLYMHFIKC